MPEVTGRDVSRVAGALAVLGLALLMVGATPFALGAEKKKAAAPAAAAGHGKPNACGCYKDAAGACLCGKKGKCGCSGDCEPRGCEEKRAKDMEREIKAETKRAQEAEKRQKSAGAKDGQDGKQEGKSGHDGKTGKTDKRPGGKKGDSARE